MENNVSTYGKVGTFICSNCTSIYNQQLNRLEISSMDTKYENCLLNYSDSTSKVNLASYIIGLAGTTQGTGQVVNENGYRYEGKNPNNYIWFNNEYWRIIGMFDSDSNGVTGKELVKIIREDPIGGLVYDVDNKNSLATASLNKLLNGAYYNAQDGTSSGYCHGDVGTRISKISGNCNYTKIGIQPYYRKMIVNVTWYLGGVSSEALTAKEFYFAERGTTIYGSNPTTSKGYIGLMYPSDYGYSSETCDEETLLSAFNTSECAGNSWMFGKSDKWTITPDATVDYGAVYFQLCGYTMIGNGSCSGVRPTLYLDPSVYIIEGDGSMDTPFIIAL